MKGKKHRQAAITGISVGGYKSIAAQQRIEFGDLTLLAGRNSSGKSSIMQPLLLLKQTLEAPFDPGALLLDGEHVNLTNASQALHGGRSTFTVELEVNGAMAIRVTFRRGKEIGFEVESLLTPAFANVRFTPGMRPFEVQAAMPGLIPPKVAEELYSYVVKRSRCFLQIVFESEQGDLAVPLAGKTESLLLSILHVRGLRGTPERTYRVTGVSENFPGPFERYAASLLHSWGNSREEQRLTRIGGCLERLGLTWGVTTRRIQDTQIEVLVGRLPRKGKRAADYVSIADVGFGVSQVLPILVALEQAHPGKEMVYVEQPEIHLHPAAQVTLGQILAEYAMRGIRIVAETHSDLLIRGIQTQVAAGKLEPERLRLHWFERSAATGATTVVSSMLDEHGAFGDWPADLDSAALLADKAYLDAVAHRRKKSA